MTRFRSLTRKERDQAGLLTWYALIARPQAEYRVQKILDDLGMTAFVPSEWRWRKKSRYQKQPTKTNYPAYKSIVFLGEGHKPIDWFKLAQIHPIIGCLANPATGFPRVINTEDIQQVMRAAKTPLFELHDLPDPDANKFQPGDVVKITDGLLYGETLTIAEVADGVARFYKEMLGKDALVEIPVDALEFQSRAA